MKAISISSLGGPEVLKLQEVATPVLERDGDILVRVKAAGVNPVDTKMRSQASAYPIRLPAVLGCDAAGVVEAVGGTVTAFQPGDEVYYCQCGYGARLGNYAEYAVVDQRLVAHKPKSLSFEQAAAAPLALITAWESLHDRARMRAGDRLLVHAGAGGVGHVAIQLARVAGAQVCTTVGSARKATFVRQLGADYPILYKDDNFSLAVLKWTDESGVDIALDTVGGKTFELTFGAVRFFGDLVTLLAPTADVDWTVARQRNLRIGFELMLSPMYYGLDSAIRHHGEILQQAAALFDADKLRIHVDEVFPLARAADAHRRLTAGQCLGKLVLTTA